MDKMRDIICCTATADQPIGMKLLESYLKRQTLFGRLLWIVSDDGDEPCHLKDTAPPWCMYIRRKRETDIEPAESMRQNMETILRVIPRGARYIAWFEHDDWYRKDHLEKSIEELDRSNSEATGDPWQRYYCVRRRIWALYRNKGSCFCQTVHRPSLLKYVDEAIELSRKNKSIGGDFRFWKLIAKEGPEVYSLQDFQTVVGIKGLPGRRGLGVGHQDGFSGESDPNMIQLQHWIGMDVRNYSELWPCQA